MSMPMVASLSGGLEEMSTASHASSSRNNGQAMIASSSKSGRNLLQPLTMADVLARAGNDPTRALDDVLAERNKLSLEASKLTTENTRLWNLMRKIRRENDELKGMRGSPATTTTSSSTHAANSARQVSPLSNGQQAATRRGAANMVAQGDQGSSTGSKSAMLQTADSDASASQSQDVLRKASSASIGRPASPLSQSTAAKELGMTTNPPLYSQDFSQSSASSKPARTPSPNGGDLAKRKAFNAPFSVDTTQTPDDGNKAGAMADVAPPPRSGSLMGMHAKESLAKTAQDSQENADLAPATSDQQRSIMEQRLAAARAQQALSHENAERAFKSQDHDVTGPSLARSILGRSASQRRTGSVDAVLPSGAFPRTFSDLTIAADHSREPSNSSRFSHKGQRAKVCPRLDVSHFTYTKVTVAGLNLCPSEQGEPTISTYFDVSVHPPAGIRSSQPSSWRIEKKLSDLCALDARLRDKNGESQLAQDLFANLALPHRQLHEDLAPSKIDLHSSLLQNYLDGILGTALPDRDDVCTFLCTDAFVIPHREPGSSTKDGFLVKKGSKQGRWVARWYALNGESLNLYEWRNGPQMGSIRIRGAQIGRQQRTSTANADENAYRHAFLILEVKASAVQTEQRQVTRHVLCAENDDDRDDWVDVLVRAIDQLSTEAHASRNNSTSQTPESTTPSRGVNADVQGKPTSMPAQSRSQSQSNLWAKLTEAPSKGANDAPTSNGVPTVPTPTQASARTTSPFSSHQSLSHLQAQAPDLPLATSVAHISGAGANAINGARSPGVEAKGWTVASSTPQQHTHHSASVRSDANQPSTAMGHQQKLPAGIISNAGQGRGETPYSYTQQRSTSHPNVHQDVGRSSYSSSRPSQDAGMVSAGSQDGSSIKERARPSISGPINGTPIPSGYKFGSREEGNGNVSISSNGAIGNSTTGSSKGDSSASTSSEGKKRFWQRFGGNSDKQSAKSKRIFGVPLVDAIAASPVVEGLELPSVVYRCIEFLEQRNAAVEEGIYRLSGSSAVIKNLTDRFNAQGDVDLLAPSEPDYDPHAIAGLLKQYLRELPSSVLTRELHLDFMRANDIADRRERVNELGSLVSMLPHPNYSLLRTLCSHLIRIIEHSDVNKMNMRNVGIVFSPTLGIPAGVFALFLTEYDWVFYTDAKGEPAPRFIDEDILAPDEDELGIASRDKIRTPHIPSSPATPSMSTSEGRSRQAGGGRNKRNSMLYNEAEAEKLFGGPHGRNRLSAQHEDTEETGFSHLMMSPHASEGGMGYGSQFGSPFLNSPQPQSQDFAFPTPLMEQGNTNWRHPRSVTDPASPLGPQQAFNPTTPVLGGGTPRMPHGSTTSPARGFPSNSYDSSVTHASPTKYTLASPGQNRARRPMQTDVGGGMSPSTSRMTPASPSRMTMKNGRS